MGVDLEQLAKMRVTFPAEQISKLPKGREDKSKRARCNECHGFHDPSMFHLDYVGHAAITDRLLNVDPEWTWEPLAVDPQGLPVLLYADGYPVGLWMRLTVCGVSRIGYGSVETGKPEAVKELIGDGLRNAAMRFGAALDLWHKGGALNADAPDMAARSPEDIPADEIAERGTNKLKAEALERTKGDKTAASKLWTSTLATLKLAADAVVPTNLHAQVHDALILATPAEGDAA